MLNGLSSEEFFCGQLDAFLVQDCSGRGAGRGPAGDAAGTKLALLTSIARATRYGELEAQVARSNHSCG